jgi:uncharacterized protein (UPF0248 family)
VSVSGTVKKIDDYEHTVVLRDGTSIPIEEIVMIDLGHVQTQFL